MNSHLTRPPILVVEGDLALRTSLAYQIRKGGYLVLALDTVALARLVVQENPLSLLVLDSGIFACEEQALCRELRANPLTEHMPILVLVNREREITQIEQMSLGVTDYLLKPLVWEELQACVQILMRGRGQSRPHRQARLFKPGQAMSPSVSEAVLTIGDLAIDLTRRSVLRQGQEVDLTRPLLFELLVYLVRHSGIVLTRTQLLAQVWGYTTPEELAGDTHTVSVHIHWLRQLLEADPERPQIIQTVRGIGYRFLEEGLLQDFAKQARTPR